ncbi:MAG: exodeoxyribonuclease VII large subunit [Planctomycetota bacterium JB042]
MTGGSGRFDFDAAAPRARGAEGAPSDEALPPDTVGVAALARRIQLALKDAFPRRVWLVGEASELERARARRSKHWFFRLVEEDAEDGRTYALGAVLWAGDVRRLFGRGGVLDGVIEPKDGIRIRALCDVDFYPPNGDLRLVVRDIDPAFTLGRLALERRRLIERLTREGVLELQKRLEVAEVPLEVGLVTAENSAAYRDFVEEVRASGLAIRIRVVDARMQGEETVRTVCRGLDTLERLDVDVICLIRGGGSAVDLAWFDAEEIVRRIAACKVPVWTGIGHEIDTSVADLAAQSAFKTPTAVAAALAERGRAARRGLDEAVRRLSRVLERTTAEEERLGRSVERLVRSRRRVEDELERLARTREAVVRSGRARIEVAGRDLRADRRLLHSRLTHALAVPRGTIGALGGRLRAIPVRAVVRREREGTGRLLRGVRGAAARRLERARERVEASDARARLLDPTHVLRRGFALLRDARGRVLKETAAVEVGARVEVELRDGRVKARVDRKEPTEPTEPNEPTEPDGSSPKGPAPRASETRRDGDEEGGEGARQLEIW